MDPNTGYPLPSGFQQSNLPNYGGGHAPGPGPAPGLPVGTQYPPANAQPVAYYYYISSKLNDMVLSVKGNNSAELTKIVLAPKKEPHEADGQLWYNDYTTGTIKSKLNNFCIEYLDFQLLMNPYEIGNTNQLWEGVCTIIRNRANPELVFEVQGGQAHDGAGLTANKYTGSPEQKFEPIFPPPPPQPSQPPQTSGGSSYPPTNLGGADGGAGYNAPQPTPTPPQPTPTPPQIPEKKLFYIVSKLNGFVMDISGENVHEGALVISFPKHPHKAKNQLWYFDEDGLIRSALNDFVPSAAGKATQLKMVRFTGGASQRFRLDGEKIVNGIGECVDIRGASRKQSAQIITYPYNGDSNQKWFIQYV